MCKLFYPTACQLDYFNQITKEDVDAFYFHNGDIPKVALSIEGPASYDRFIDIPISGARNPSLSIKIDLKSLPMIID